MHILFVYKENKPLEVKNYKNNIMTSHTWTFWSASSKSTMGCVRTILPMRLAISLMLSLDSRLR
jgi:hypothetical protein